MIHQMFLFVRDWSKRSVNEYPSARAEEVLRPPPRTIHRSRFSSSSLIIQYEGFCTRSEYLSHVWQPGHFLFFRHLEVLLNNILNLTKSSFFNKLLSVLLDSLLPQSDRLLCYRRYDHPSAGTKNNRTPRNRKSIADAMTA